ncbi:MAG: RNA polymerase sigma factor [Nannocystales bacterium]
MTESGSGPQWGSVAAHASEPEFSEVYRSHYDFVWRCVRRLGVPASLVDDATQEVFVIVHRRLSSYDPRTPMRGWLFGILRKVAASQRRRAKRVAPVPSSVRSSADSDPEAALARREAADWVERFLATLDEEQRAVFVLAECEGVPVVELADTLGIKLNTAYSRLRLARRRFERALVRVQARAQARARVRPVVQAPARSESSR